MEIKKLYFGIFEFGETYNHLLQMEDGTWYFAHIPKARKITNKDVRYVPTRLALRYVADGVEFDRLVIERNYQQTGLVLV